MPIGCSSFVPAIATCLARQQARSVLDLGVGMGMYGAVVRQYLDLGVQPWKTRLDGVEGFAGYRNPCWDLYDHVFEHAIEQFLPWALDQWDAILLLDVLEHFEREAGEQVIAAARERLTPGGRLYVGTPAVWIEQGAAYGNELERHRSLWTAADLEQLGGAILMDGRPDRWGNQMLLAAFGYSMN